MCVMLLLVAVPLLDFASVHVLALLAGCIAWRLFLRRRLAVWIPVVMLGLGALMIQLVQGSVFSMDGGIAVLIVLLGAKLLESRTPHDFQVLGMVGWFLCLCGLLSEQTLSRSLSSGWRSLKKRVPPQFRLHAVAAGGEGADGTSGW